MDLNRACSSFILQGILFLLLAELAAFTVFISADVLESRGSLGRRRLLQTNDCPVAFEFKNYTIVTSKCKGPELPPDQCCPAFKELACPYKDELKDDKCNSIFYSYLTLYGNYQQGYFANVCSDNTAGMDCTGYLPKTENSTVTSGNLALSLSPVAVFVAGFTLAIQFS